MKGKTRSAAGIIVTMENRDTIYENFPLEKVKTQVGFQKRCLTSRCVIMCLGLLCVTLLAGNIALIVIYVMDLSPGLYNCQLQANSDCKLGWTKFNGSCYIVSSSKLTWEQSRDDCKAQGADLVTIKSKEEKAFVNGLLRSREQVWIGLLKVAKKKEWEWVDQTPVSTMQVQDNLFFQPNRNSRNSCGGFTQTSSNGNCYDAPCSSNKVWICEKKKTNTL